MTPKEEYYRYGESLGIKINDLQRLKMLADNCQEDMKPLLKTLFALWETLAERGEISVGVDFTKHYEILKQQLNKQDYDKNY